MDDPAASVQLPPPRPHGSPTATRLALGRAVPRPLDLASGSATTSYSTSTPSASSSSYTSPPATASHSLVSPRAHLASPATPDRAAGLAGPEPSNGRRSAANEAPGPSTAHAHAPSPTSSTALASLPSPPAAARPSTLSFPSPVAGYAARRASSKLPTSASTTSIGGRSVLGYTSAARRTGSPSRGASGAHTAMGASGGAGAGATGAGGAGAGASGSGSGTTSSSRFLLTVVPPEHLPHDPPHPRTNPACSGYGPPEHFRRGTLVPLYPTLSSQLAAIAREYGLPSSGGLVLYLLSTTNPTTQQPFPQAASFAGEGGPRISDGAWNLLWAQLMAEEEAEREMLLHEQQQREQDLLDSDDASDYDNDYHPPPVPPIPSEHVAARQREQSEDVGLCSDEHEHERVSQSSADGGASDGKAPRADNRASTIARAGLGRGPPPSSMSPGAGVKRFSSFPTAAHPSLARRSSRQSLRSASHRTATHRTSSYGYATAPPSARATSYGSARYASGPASLFSPSAVGGSAFLPGYGASVVVGKVEFDIHAGSRQGKWYEAWLASASQPASSGASTASTPAVAASAPSMAVEQPHQQWQELQLPGMVANGARAPQQVEEPAARGLGIVAPPPRHEPSSFDAATLASAAFSSSSLAAMAGHSPTGSTRERALAQDDSSPRESESTPLAETVALPLAHEHDTLHGDAHADSSIVDKLAPASSPDHAQLHPADTTFGSLPPPSRAPSSLPSRPASTASTLMENGDSSASEHGSTDAHLVDGENGYAPLEDEDEAEHAVKAPTSDADSDELRYGSATTEDGGEPGELVRGDPLADVFESDEATWRSIADDDSYPRLEERDAVDTTGLGISGARNVHDLEPAAAPGVLERREQDETLDERGLPPPQDDVRDVMSMLSSTPTTATHPVNLASPIRLDSSGAAATDTGVFPPSPVQQVVDRERSFSHEQEERSSPFLPSHSAATSISTVNFSVRPPSTIASMSPEYVQNRTQRQGWTNVPAVVDPSLSNSSSMSSISAAGGASDSARSSSSTGLMENLDDLERALADLSPRASARARMGARSPAAVLEAAAEVPQRAAAPRPTIPPRTSSREQAEEAEAASAVPASPAPPSSLLASRPAFRYRAPSSPGGSAVSEANDAPAAAATELAAPAEPVRIPRSSSLSKPEVRADLQPHLVALPPSPMPANVAAFASSPDALDEPLPSVPSASPSWSAAPLPPSPSPPAQPFENLLPHAANTIPPPPPPPQAVDEVQPSQPRSPGAKKGGFKWGSRNKSIDAGKANAVPPSAGDAQSPSGDEPSSSSGAKSPLGSFFGKFGKGDKKSFFRRGESTSPEPPIPAPATDAAAPVLPALPPRQPSLDAETEHFFSGFGRPRRPSASAGSTSQLSEVGQEAPVPPVPAALVAETVPSSSSSQQQEQEAPAPSLSPLAALTQVQQREELFGAAAPSTPTSFPTADESLPLAAEAFSPSDSQRTSSPPLAQLDFPAPPPSTSAAATPIEPPQPRASSSFGSRSPRASLSAQSSTSASSSAASASTLLSPTQPAFPFSSALPPSPVPGATATYPLDAPGTPRAAALSPPSSAAPVDAASTADGAPALAAPATPRYPASAPVTPAAWNLSSRAALGTPSPSSVSTSAATGSGNGASPLGASTSASARSRARLSADIEGLLSQMREIDFALEDPPAAAAVPATSSASTAAAAAAAVEPVEKAPALLKGLEREAVEPQPELDEPVLSLQPTPTLVEPDEDTSLAYAGAATPDLSSSLSSLSGFGTPPQPVRAYAGVGAGASASPGLGPVSMSLGVPGMGDDGELPRPLSADLRAIGSVMTLGSPPTSPELASPRYDPLQLHASPTRA
ncbi:hypothetical protein JCM9279_002731 [Rhodotorula babjevae]